jgi:transposase
MSSNKKSISCSKKQQKEVEALKKIASSRKMEARLVQRAQIVLKRIEGRTISKVAQEQGVCTTTVVSWYHRFESEGIAGLHDRSRSGKPSVYKEEFRNQVLELLEQPPPDGQASWDGPSVARHLNVSADAVWRLLRKEGICLSRQRSWCISTDPEFVAKTADIIGLYLNPPENVFVISVDEKPTIQVLERSTGYVRVTDKRIVRGFKSTYKRHGTLNLFAALEISTGIIHGKTTKQKRKFEFLEFMDEIVKEIPASKGKEIHVIMDNHSIHKKNDEWLKVHPNVFFHFTPTSASWLNQVEIWFGIMTRKVLRGASHKEADELISNIEKFIEAYNHNPKPFVWRKREVKGSQLKNTIRNLCN